MCNTELLTQNYSQNINGNQTDYDDIQNISNINSNNEASYQSQLLNNPKILSQNQG
jgi:hypothetical protein